MKTDNQSATDFSRDDGLLISPSRDVAVGGADRSGFLLNHQTIPSGDSRQILELEIENARLQRLVAELLIKNQQLRQMCDDSKRMR